MSAKLSKADKLAAAAAEAAEVRAHQVNPDVIALGIERTRAWVDRLIWTGLIMGLAFTMVNVAEFAAGEAAPPWSDDANASMTWVTAWLLDPMVSLVLIGVLMGEQVINRYRLKAGGWVRATKWVALGCTYGMNTWASWVALDAAAIVLHSVPPVIVFCAAEAVVTLRQQLTKAVEVAFELAVKRARALAEAAAAEAAAAELPAVEPTRTEAVEPVRTEVVEPVRTEAVEPVRTEVVEPVRTEAVEPLRTEAVEPTRTEAARPRPALGKRETARAERAAVVEKLAAEIRTATAEGRPWRPDYAALTDGGARSRSWAEKVVADARRAVNEADDAKGFVPGQLAIGVAR